MSDVTLKSFLAELQSCPSAAVEQPLLQSLYRQDPAFFQVMPLRARWQLLAGLHNTLLDYTSAKFSPLDLDRQSLPLPVRGLTIPVAQLIDAVTTANFELDQISWAEELELDLSESEDAACDQALIGAAAEALVDQLCAKGLAFLASCDLS